MNGNKIEEVEKEFMWEDIILSLVSVVFEATCSKWFEKKKRERLLTKINSLVKEKMKSYADTSLDCDDFYTLIQSRNFIDMTKNFFCSIRDGLSSEAFTNRIEEYIHEECPTTKRLEVKHFVNDIELLYKDYLHKMIQDSPDLSAAFQLMTISHRDIVAKISESEENMKKYFSSIVNDKVQIDDEEIKSYHEVCRKEYGIIRFTGISGAENRKVQDIDKFYIENTFSYYLTKESRDSYRNGLEQIDDIRLKDFFNIGNKIVLIGAAGLGKSTTLNYLFCNYEKMYDSFSLKIKIDLKEYAKEIGENKRDLLWCIATEFSKKVKRAKMNFSEIEEILTNYLESGKCLVILDALDEIPTQAVRERVRNEIANFCEIYYLNRFIISTREAGYLRNSFDDSFFHIKINDFREEQIKKYSENWFCTFYRKKDFLEFWEKFYKEVRRARCENLIRNPIVLILALVIFDIEKNLPNRRVEFYKKCIETFLTVREDRKAAYILNEKTKNILGIDSVVPKIAFYKYSHLEKNIGYKFSYDELRNAVFNAIEVEDEINWGDAVKQYAEYLVDRTELIREIDEDVLDFAHKTFYEYFLAVYFTKEYDNNELKELLHEWIGDPNNDELARLIIEVIIQKDDPKQHRTIIKYLFDSIQTGEVDEWDNRTDVFTIIADLYSHNMLQPRFHLEYNKTLLFYPRYVENVNSIRNRRYWEMKEQGVQYDSSILADMFCDECLSNNNLIYSLDALYYLDNEFRHRVVEQLKEESIAHIAELFSIVRSVDYKNLKRNNKKSKEKLSILVQYFINSGLDSLLNFPQVYVSVIDIIVMNTINVDMKELMNYRFEANNSFYFYSVPKVLLEIVEKSIENKDVFLILLILMIHCSKKRTNVLFGYLFDIDNRVKKSEEDKTKRILDFVCWLWNSLNIIDDSMSFQENLVERELFIPERESIYEELIAEYRNREMSVKDNRILEYLDKRK